MRLSIWTQVGAVLLVATTCAPPETEAPAERQVDLESLDPTGARLTFWYQHGRIRGAALLELIGEFNRTNPDSIEVAGEFAGSYGDIYNKMMVGLQGGSLPDLLVAYQNQALAYFEADGLVDLTPYIESPTWGLTKEERADYVEAFLAQDNLRGQQICFPPNRSVEILYFNLDWLAQLGYDGPPTTWETFAAVCRQARDIPFLRGRPGDRSIGLLLFADASRLASMVFSRGGDLVSDDGTAYTLATPHMRQALELMQELIAEKAADLVGDPDEDLAGFAVGDALFVIRSSSNLPFARSAVEEGGLGFRWGVGPLPYEGEAPIANIYGASIAVGRTTPERQLASWLFLKWFTEPKQQARWAQASNYFPVRYSTAAELKPYFAANPRYKVVYDLLRYGKAEPSIPGYQLVRRIIEETMVEVGQGGDIGRAMSSLQRRANATLDN